MKKTAIILSLLTCFAFASVNAQNNGTNAAMVKVYHKYIIEREIPGAGKLSQAQLNDIATKSCVTIYQQKNLVQWLESYVTENKVYCVYLAENEEAIREHARLAGFPVNKISEVKTMLDPTAAK